MATKATSAVIVNFLLKGEFLYFFFFFYIDHCWQYSSWEAVSSLDSHISLRLEAQFEERWRNVFGKANFIGNHIQTGFHLSVSVLHMAQPQTPNFNKQQQKSMCPTIFKMFSFLMFIFPFFKYPTLKCSDLRRKKPWHQLDK